MYPYASQAFGQIGFQGQINYQIKRKSKIGGRYGTDIMINYSRIHKTKQNLTQEVIDAGGNMDGTDGYTSPFFGAGKLLFQDLNVEISRKFNNTWKLTLGYVFFIYNQEALEGHVGDPNITSHTVIADLTCKINNKHALRLELQHLFTKEGRISLLPPQQGNWIYGLLEYSIAPKWFIAVMDSYNYGNENKSNRIQYFNISGAFVYKTTKISVNFGKQYKGILCVGGACRTVPASYGAGLTIVSNF
jgi:hypothetical protein